MKMEGRDYDFCLSQPGERGERGREETVSQMRVWVAGPSGTIMKMELQ